MAFGFASVTATPAQANESWECAQDGGQWSPTNDGGWTCLHPVEAQVKDVEPLERYAGDGYDRARQEVDWIGEDESGNIIYGKDGRVIGVETANADINASVCAMSPTIPDCSRKAEEAEGEQVAWDTELSYDEGCWGTLCTHNGSDGSPKSEEVQGEQFAGKVSQEDKDASRNERELRDKIRNEDSSGQNLLVQAMTGYMDVDLQKHRQEHSTRFQWLMWQA